MHEFWSSSTHASCWRFAEWSSTSSTRTARSGIGRQLSSQRRGVRRRLEGKPEALTQETKLRMGPDHNYITEDGKREIQPAALLVTVLSVGEAR